MDTTSRISIWLSRVTILAATAIFILISSRYLTDPVGMAGTAKISLGSPTAITIIRVGFGAFPLGFAVIALVCLFSNKRLLTGLYIVGTVIILATVIRIYGAVVDGATPETLKLLRPEFVMVVLSVSGIFLERRRLRLTTRKKESIALIS